MIILKLHHGAFLRYYSIGIENIIKPVMFLLSQKLYKKGNTDMVIRLFWELVQTFSYFYPKWRLEIFTMIQE